MKEIGKIYNNKIDDTEFELYNFHYESDKNIIVDFPDPSSSAGLENEYSRLVSNFRATETDHFYAWVIFVNATLNSSFESKKYKNGNYINSEFWTNKNVISSSIWPYYPVSGAGVYGVEIYYNDQLVLSGSTEVLP